MLRRALLPFALLALAGCVPRSKLDYGDASVGSESWSEGRIARDAYRADAELREIMAQIDSGELPRIEFDFDSAKIRYESYPTLDVIADFLLRHPRQKLRVRAHTCSIGTAEYNQDLSERRAKSIENYLAKQGVPPPSIRFKGVGFSEPRFDNATEEGRRQNRRVEFTLAPREWNSVY